MPETNLIDIYPVDEAGTTVAEPTDWLRSLPVASRISKLEHFLAHQQAEYEMAADAMERSHIAKLMGAARRYLEELQRGGARKPAA